MFLQPKVEDGSASTTVYIFGPESSQPLAEHTLPLQLRNVASIGSLQDTKSYSLIGLTRDSRVVCIGDSQSPSTTQKPALSFQSGRATVFQDMFGGADLGSIEATSSSSVPAVGPRQIGDISTQPSHLMAPVSSLFEPLMASLLHLNAGASSLQQPASDDEGSDDEAMEDIVMTSTTTGSSFTPIDPATLDSFVAFFRKSCHTQSELLPI